MSISLKISARVTRSFPQTRTHFGSITSQKFPWNMGLLLDRTNGAIITYTRGNQNCCCWSALNFAAYSVVGFHQSFPLQHICIRFLLREMQQIPLTLWQRQGWQMQGTIYCTREAFSSFGIVNYKSGRSLEKVGRKGKVLGLVVKRRKSCLYRHKSRRSPLWVITGDLSRTSESFQRLDRM